VSAALERWRERLLDALHRAGVDRINRLVLKIIGEHLRLTLAVRRQVHVNDAAELLLIARFHLAVADE